MTNLGSHLPPEHHVEFREPEDKRVALVDQHDVDGFAQVIGKSRRKFEAAESRTEHYHARTHLRRLPL